MKVLDKIRLDERSQDLFNVEVACMVKLAHPNIVCLYEVVETLKRLYLVMEYASGGELFSRISTRGRLSDLESKLVFYQVLSAVKHMVSLLQSPSELQPLLQNKQRHDLSFFPLSLLPSMIIILCTGT